MQNSKHLLCCLSLTGLLALTGCSFPGVYKVDIQQGNVVTQDMVDQLRPGMTMPQVRYIMGSPLVSDTFNTRRWDYIYSIQLGNKKRQQERISLLFDSNDRLIALGGDFKPGVSRDEAILGAESGVTSFPAGVNQEPLSEPTQQPKQPATPAGELEKQLQEELDSTQQEATPTPRSIE
ncbi:outer membrane protein assembly factor BamE [Pseudomonas sp. F1_0610]|uniref:outer membrane protein assembly factor BamE n=1 Tax=Pseudomonas sp. F1_0610 TaxID=3114284 RepID=UPI0039C439B7